MIRLFLDGLKLMLLEKSANYQRNAVYTSQYPEDSFTYAWGRLAQALADLYRALGESIK